MDTLHSTSCQSADSHNKQWESSSGNTDFILTVYIHQNINLIQFDIEEFACIKPLVWLNTNFGLILIFCSKNLHSNANSSYIDILLHNECETLYPNRAFIFVLYKRLCTTAESETETNWDWMNV